MKRRSLHKRVFDVLRFLSNFYMSTTCCFQSMWMVGGFGDREVVKLASHPDGKHHLALTKDGEVLSWGNGDGGRLGHGDNM